MPREATPEERLWRLEKRLDALELTVARLPPIPTIYGPETSTSARNFNEDFVVSTVRDAMVSYTVEMTTSATSAGAVDSDALVELMVDGEVVHSARNRLVATLTSILGLLGLSLSSNVQRWTLGGYVKAGQTLRIQTSGNGSATMISVQEALL